MFFFLEIKPTVLPSDNSSESEDNGAVSLPLINTMNENMSPGIIHKF